VRKEASRFVQVNAELAAMSLIYHGRALRLERKESAFTHDAKPFGLKTRDFSLREKHGCGLDSDKCIRGNDLTPEAQGVYQNETWGRLI
jgi:hypothetical protein